MGNYQNIVQNKEITYLITAAEGFCRRVFTKSNGWKSTVENVPENDPAKKALRIGYCKKNKK